MPVAEEQLVTVRGVHRHKEALEVEEGADSYISVTIGCRRITVG